MQIINIQNDSIDSICWRHYGNSDMVEAVLQANPHLAKFGVILPIGTPVHLPDKVAQSKQKTSIQLWN